MGLGAGGLDDDQVAAGWLAGCSEEQQQELSSSFSSLLFVQFPTSRSVSAAVAAVPVVSGGRVDGWTSSKSVFLFSEAKPGAVEPMRKSSNQARRRNHK